MPHHNGIRTHSSVQTSKPGDGQQQTVKLFYPALPIIELLMLRLKRDAIKVNFKSNFRLGSAAGDFLTFRIHLGVFFEK